MDLVVGVDAGGSTTRAVVVDTGDTVVGAATAPAGNAASVAPAVLAERLAGCLRECLAGVELARVSALGAGVAGFKATGGAAARVVEGAARAAGLTCPVRVYSDLETAYAAGSDQPDGVVLIAGTGASAARVAGFRAQAMADGAGWLLGDEGGGFWIARRAIQRSLEAIDGRGPATVLLPALAEGLLGPSALQAERPPAGAAVVAAAMSGHPVQLAALAPRVFAVADAGDEVARGIVDDAARRLVRTVAALRPQAGEPLVLAGGLLGPGGPLSEPVRRLLSEHGWTSATAVADGSLGAVRLARIGLADS